jgi:hypothetical protein
MISGNEAGVCHGAPQRWDRIATGAGALAAVARRDSATAGKAAGMEAGVMINDDINEERAWFWVG